MNAVEYTLLLSPPPPPVACRHHNRAGIVIIATRSGSIIVAPLAVGKWKRKASNQAEIKSSLHTPETRK